MKLQLPLYCYIIWEISRRTGEQLTHRLYIFKYKIVPWNVTENWVFGCFTGMLDLLEMKDTKGNDDYNWSNHDRKSDEESNWVFFNSCGKIYSTKTSDAGCKVNSQVDGSHVQIETDHSIANFILKTRQVQVKKAEKLSKLNGNISGDWVSQLTRLYQGVIIGEGLSKVTKSFSGIGFYQHVNTNMWLYMSVHNPD